MSEDCRHINANFDRSLCACGSMHYYCDDCGIALDCPLVDEPRDESGYPGLQGLLAIQRKRQKYEAPKGYGSDVGSKADAGKPRTDLYPFGALLAVAEVMTFGAEKYSAHNWKGLSVSRLIGASFRHGFAWMRGEDLDPETGYSHLAHMACCVLMALDQVLERPQYDDRDRAH